MHLIFWVFYLRCPQTIRPFKYSYHNQAFQIGCFSPVEHSSVFFFLSFGRQRRRLTRVLMLESLSLLGAGLFTRHVLWLSQWCSKQSPHQWHFCHAGAKTCPQTSPVNTPHNTLAHAQVSHDTRAHTQLVFVLMQTEVFSPSLSCHSKSIVEMLYNNLDLFRNLTIDCIFLHIISIICRWQPCK